MTGRYVHASGPRRAYLIHGEDAGLVSQELSVLVDELRALDPVGLDVVEEYGEPGREEPVDVGEILTACQTMPFFSELRVVVMRDARALDAAQQKAVAAYVADPAETSVLVLACVGRPPAALVKAVTAGGAVIAATPGTNARERSRWVAEHVRQAGVQLDASATERLTAHLGEDLSRLEGIVGALSAAYGVGTSLHVEDVEPFLGEAGGMAPWDLTDAIDAGDMANAIDVLHRLLGADRHPLQILATLQRHVTAMLRLDGAEISDDRSAAEATGLSPYPARKALEQSRRLGHDRLVSMTTLLADADLDLRGRTGWPPELVVDVLVGRLARLSARRAGPVGARRGARAR